MIAAVGTLLILSTNQATAAGEFPSKPVRLVSPFAPGTNGEQLARLMAPKLEALWKVPVLVENRPGASGTIGAEHVARSAPDGHTILVGSLGTQMAKLTAAELRFDPQVDLVPVTKYADTRCSS